MKHIKTFEKYSLFKQLFGSDKSDDNELDFNKSDDNIRIGDRGENVGRLQKSLEALGFKLWIYGVDNIMGNETLGQTKSLLSFLKRHSEFNEFIDNRDLLTIKNNTVTTEQQKLIHELASDDEVKNEISAYFQELEKKIGKTDLVGKKEIMRHIEDPEEFISKLYDISKKLQINPNWLLIVMWKESKINPKAQNSKTKATGLIQFMPSTLRDKRYGGITVDDLRKMSGVQQLDYVYKYFKPYAGRIKSAQDLYLVTFFPAAMGKDDDYILQTKDVSAETIASQNKGVDLNSDGQITKGEFDDYVTKGLPKSWKTQADKKFDV